MHLLIFFKMHWGKVDVDNSVLQKLLFLEKKKKKTNDSLPDTRYCDVTCWGQQCFLCGPQHCILWVNVNVSVIFELLFSIASLKHLVFHTVLASCV